MGSPAQAGFRTRLAASAALGLGLALLALGSAPALAGSRATLLSASGCSARTAKARVTIDATNQLKFSPSFVCLRKGGTVTWHNTGDVSHTTTDEKSLAANASDARLPAGAKAWSHSLAPGRSWSLKLTVTGTYRYFCIPHEELGMKGRIEVVK